MMKEMDGISSAIFRHKIKYAKYYSNIPLNLLTYLFAESLNFTQDFTQKEHDFLYKKVKSDTQIAC